MMIDYLSLFPEVFKTPLEASLVGAARERGLFEYRTHDLRDWTHDRHRTVDDYPYGGGAGMVMKPEPIIEALEDISQMDGGAPYTIFLTPSGVPFTQEIARDLSSRERLIIVSGRYEGFDERAYSAADLRLSIGDYVLTGGEFAALVVTDAVVRLIPGVLGCTESTQDESFEDGLLEYPHYTRPAEYRGMSVPEVLLSGDHGRVARWRARESLETTRRFRPDMLDEPDRTPPPETATEGTRS